MEEHSIPRNKCKITFLGTGTSSGVPQIGCSCKVCTSNDPRDRRMRCSSLVEINGTRILIDCGPDFYFQMLKIPFGQINGVLVTHEHYDHVGGLDDLRPFCRFGTINIYGNDVTLKHLHDRIPYCFKEHLYRGVPHLNLVEVTPHKEFSINGVNVIPLRVMHGNMEILGYRIGRMAYITDMTRVFAVGQLPHEAYRAHQVALEIQSAIEGMAKPGVACADLYMKALEIVKAAGLEEYFMGTKLQAKFVGHGIGLQINELPVLTPRSKEVLLENMVFALEPKFVIPGVGAVGVENSFLVKADGLEKLTLFPEEIIQLQ